MKNKTPHTTTGVLHKIEIIEDEVANRKFSIAKNVVPSKKNLVSLKGLHKGLPSPRRIFKRPNPLFMAG